MQLAHRHAPRFFLVIALAIYGFSLLALAEDESGDTSCGGG